jgi:hypothetical protein
MVVLAAGVAAPAAARLLETRDAALRRLFGAGARFEARVAWLTPALAESVTSLAHVRCDATPITYWVATRNDSVLGHAYLDTRTVRTMPATFLVVIDAQHAVSALEVLAFHEPPDYLPPRRWLARLCGRRLAPAGRTSDRVDAISGATLSSRAAHDAAALALAIDRTLGTLP